ncbi:MAG: alanine racemase, partial [Chloroflexi bacterium]|nr:alanine racemase [Chloroflexota bacterium]
SITVEAINHVLATQYPTLQSSGHLDGRLKLPQTLAKLTPEHRMAILEFNTTQPGEMQAMIDAIQPQVGVVTNLRLAYTDRFENPDQFAKETALMIEKLPPDGLAVLSYDDDQVREMAIRAAARVLTVGLEGFGADLIAYNIVVGTTRTGFDLRYGDERFVGRWTPLLGKHRLYSILTAVAVGVHYEIAPTEALRALTEMQPLPGRMNPLNGNGGSLLIDDSFSADPQSTLAALEWLQAVTEGSQQRAIFVLGNMDNLGGFTQRGHRMVGQRASEFVDMFITEGTDAALAGRAALDQDMEPRKVAITYSIQDVLNQLQATSKITSDDIILVKGGPSARMELVSQALLADPADERQLPRNAQLTEASSFLRPTHPSWVEIDLAALARNVRAIKDLTGPEITLIAVVKADAYGHGAVAVARTALLNGAAYLAVSSINEALELREAGIEAPILIVNYVPVQAMRQVVRQNLTVTLYDLELARAYNRAAREAGGVLKSHVKIDTGMGRLGVMAGEAVAFFRHLLNLNNIEIEGIYTHFSTADDDLDHANEQLRVFKSVVTPLRASGYNFKYIHAANTAAMLTLPASHFNAVRVGLGMYGLSPSAKARLPEAFTPALTWKTMIAQVKTLPPGHPVGYGNTYRTATQERIAVLPVGYANGFRRSPHHWGKVLVQGEFAPIIGRISMEKLVINVSQIPEVAIGDEVVLLGRQGNARITADDIADRLGTISYEVLTTILPRVPRR